MREKIPPDSSVESDRARRRSGTQGTEGPLLLPCSSASLPGRGLRARTSNYHILDFRLSLQHLFFGCAQIIMPVFGFLPVLLRWTSLTFFGLENLRVLFSRVLDYVNTSCTSYTSYTSCIKCIFLCRFNCLSPIFIGVLVFTFVVKYSLTFLLCRFICIFSAF